MPKKKLQLIFFPLILFGALGLVKNSQAATLYVDDTSCSDSRTYAQVQNIGTPWCTIQKAADNVLPGDTVIVRDGTYTDNDQDSSVVLVSKGGTSSNWVTFKAEHNGLAKINGQGKATSYGFFFNNIIGYVKFEGFEIYDTKNGFWINGTDVHDITIFANNLHDIGNKCCLGGQGIYTGPGMNIANINVDSNLFHDIGRLHNSDGCSCVPDRYVDDHALEMHNAYSNIFNNIFYNIDSGTTLKISGAYFQGGGSHFKVINNTFGQSQYPFFGTLELEAYEATNFRTQDDILIQNNIFKTGIDTHSILFVPSADNGNPAPWTNISIKNNLTSSSNLVWAYHPGVTAISGNLEARDPLFVNYGAHNFRLNSGSPAINQGLALNTPKYDFSGTVRPQGTGYDLGAYEYSGADTVPPAAPSGLRVQ